MKSYPGKHRYNPIDLDFNGDWDGVVKFDRNTKEFYRYLDRNGDHKKCLSLVCLCQGRNDTTPGYRCSTCIGLEKIIYESLYENMQRPLDLGSIYGEKLDER